MLGQKQPHVVQWNIDTHTHPSDLRPPPPPINKWCLTIDALWQVFLIVGLFARYVCSLRQVSSLSSPVSMLSGLSKPGFHCMFL